MTRGTRWVRMRRNGSILESGGVTKLSLMGKARRRVEGLEKRHKESVDLDDGGFNKA